MHKYLHSIHTVLLRACTHGCTQFKQQNYGVGTCMEMMLEWFNYARASAYPRFKVTC